FFFFFSSRRRHTRSKRDWSSDVCSSDLLSRHLEEFIDAYYNRLRLPSALGYRTPEEFERDATAAAPASSGGNPDAAVMTYFTPRSEEHTSELQSRFDLVCRLLLEKKNKI